MFFNHSTRAFSIKSGDRIAQLILEGINNSEVVEQVSSEERRRGEAGFGSIGVCNSLSTAKTEEIFWEEHLAARWGVRRCIKP